MATKPYPQNEEKPVVANEPAVAYQRTDPSTYRKKPMKPEFTQEEIDEMVAEWLQPLTLEQINQWNKEAEEADEANDEEYFISSEEMFAEMERKFPWLCK